MLTETTETTTTVVTTRIVRKPPITLVRTVTNEVLKGGGDNNIDYGDYGGGQFHIRGVQGYNDTSIGGAKILGQIQAPSGCGGYVQLDATFYKGGTIVGTEFTNFTSLPSGSWVPFSINLLAGSMDTYDLLLTRADC